MEGENEKANTPDVDRIITSINEDVEQEKEEKLVNLIIEIIVSSTLKEYEKSNKIS